jgi:uncharacterized protein (DUF4415 family)
MSESQIRRTSPPDLESLPPDFWESTQVHIPVPKHAISLRLDEEVLDWFKSSGPRYQSRMNAVLRHYMAAMHSRRSRMRGKSTA